MERNENLKEDTDWNCGNIKQRKRRIMKMTEQEKMKNGYLWDDDEENMALQAHAKKLVRQFTALPPEDMNGRAALLPGAGHPHCGRL